MGIRAVPDRLTVHEALASMARGEVTSVELVARLAETIRATDEAVGAYLSVDETGAIQQA